MVVKMEMKEVEVKYCDFCGQKTKGAYSTCDHCGKDICRNHRAQTREEDCSCVECNNQTRTLKLFVWKDFCSDYKPGLAFAIAYSQREAEVLITKEMGCEINEWGTLTVYLLNETIAKCVQGGS